MPGAASGQGREDGWTDVILCTSLWIHLSCCSYYWRGTWPFLRTETISQQTHEGWPSRSCPEKCLLAPVAHQCAITRACPPYPTAPTGRRVTPIHRPPDPPEPGKPQDAPREAAEPESTRRRLAQSPVFLPAPHPCPEEQPQGAQFLRSNCSLHAGSAPCTQPCSVPSSAGELAMLLGMG